MTKRILSILILVLTIQFGYSQTNNTNHPTIGSLGVAYKSAPTGSASANLSDIKCIPQATITLKPNVNATIIHFKMYKAQNNELVYSISYPLNNQTVTNQDGIIMFKNTNGVINISNGAVVKLQPYIYKIETEDAQNNLTITYEEIK